MSSAGFKHRGAGRPPGFATIRAVRGLGASESVEELETFEIETGPAPGAAIIWLHGLGADAHDFEPVVPLLHLGPERPVRYVFPNAPVRPVTINGGMEMRAWYDILSFDRDESEDEAGIRASAAAIERLIQREASRGIGPARVVLAGFSQGGAVALFTALRYADPLAGVVALSTYLPLAEAAFIEANPANAGLPVFMGHGTGDDVVPINFGRGTRKKLHASGYDVRWAEYPMPHSVIPEELADIRAFLGQVL